MRTKRPVTDLIKGKLNVKGKKKVSKEEKHKQIWNSKWTIPQNEQRIYKSEYQTVHLWRVFPTLSSDSSIQWLQNKLYERAVLRLFFMSLFNLQPFDILCLNLKLKIMLWIYWNAFLKCLTFAEHKPWKPRLVALCLSVSIF